MAWISVHRNIVYHWNPRVRCRHNVWKEGGTNISMEVQIFLNVGTVGNVFMGGPNSTWQINLHSFVCGLYCTNLQSGYTLLHDAACGGSVELLKWLVEEKGLDVQEWNKVFLYFKKIAAWWIMLFLPFTKPHITNIDLGNNLWKHVLSGTASFGS